MGDGIISECPSTNTSATTASPNSKRSSSTASRKSPAPSVPAKEPPSNFLSSAPPYPAAPPNPPPALQAEEAAAAAVAAATKSFLVAARIRISRPLFPESNRIISGASYAHQPFLSALICHRRCRSSHHSRPGRNLRRQPQYWPWTSRGPRLSHGHRRRHALPRSRRHPRPVRAARLFRLGISICEVPRRGLSDLSRRSDSSPQRFPTTGSRQRRPQAPSHFPPRRSGQFAQSKNRAFLSGFSAAICGSIAWPSHFANFPVGNFVRAYGLVQRFHLGRPCRHHSRPFSCQHRSPSSSTQHLRRRSHRSRPGLCLLRRKKQIAWP